MCDIDHFKAINDSRGHLVGDEVIKLVARSLQDSSRGSDVVARLGGDEFLVVLPDSQPSGGVALVERVRTRLEERNELRDLPISLSFGIAATQGERTEEETIARADAALYAAKRQGRGRHCLAE